VCRFCADLFAKTKRSAGEEAAGVTPPSLYRCRRCGGSERWRGWGSPMYVSFQADLLGHLAPLVTPHQSPTPWARDAARTRSATTAEEICGRTNEIFNPCWHPLCDAARTRTAEICGCLACTAHGRTSMSSHAMHGRRGSDARRFGGQPARGLRTLVGSCCGSRRCRLVGRRLRPSLRCP
jgi:hypothetical protein